MQDLLTTRAAASLLGVGTTSIKRWADAGVLSCVKTPGGHRRFPRDSVLAMLDKADIAEAESFGDDTEGWLRLLLEGTEATSVRRRLLSARNRVGSWWQVADELSPVLDELGVRWEAGKVGIIPEHLATERLLRGLIQCATELEVPSGAPTALLLTADGEEHTIGLALVELCLREAGWNTRWAGVRTPLAALERFLHDVSCDLVAVSASRSSRDALHLRDQAARLSAMCASSDATLVLGGAGAWPEALEHGYRVRTFYELHRVCQPPMNGHRNMA